MINKYRLQSDKAGRAHEEYKHMDFSGIGREKTDFGALLRGHLTEEWRHLYRAKSVMVLHATVMNERFMYLKEYVDRGCNVN